MLIGIFGATVTGVLTALPVELVVAIGGQALPSKMRNALSTALHEEYDHESALITFLLTLSGVSLAGVGSAFWGVVAGTLAALMQHYRRRLL